MVSGDLFAENLENCFAKNCGPLAGLPFPTCPPLGCDVGVSCTLDPGKGRNLQLKRSLSPDHLWQLKGKRALKRRARAFPFEGKSFCDRGSLQAIDSKPIHGGTP